MFEIASDAQVHPSARINVRHGMIGKGAIIREHCVIEGSEVVIGRDAFLNRGASIGGGSCFDPQSNFFAGDFLHMGFNSHINTAMGVSVGHEFGFGVESKIFTHGAYPSAWEGFPTQWAPVRIGHNVWLPNAWVNPGVTIGRDVVVAAGSVVSRDLPAGCFAAGAPARVLKEGAYPRRLPEAERRALWAEMFGRAQMIAAAKVGAGDVSHSFTEIDADSYRVDGATTFHVGARMIEGAASDFTEILRNQLRRNGIRFRYEIVRHEYRPWGL
ncbi:MAG: hypothetical protein IT557_15310 [Alphaproteobacteria bacterium]|nr:hypothetical protein [Alphaproteobacteria bacterium]